MTGSSAVAESQSFTARLRRAIETAASLLCVGIDPDLVTCPDARSVERFSRHLVASTIEVACAYKANTAFFEQHGAAGWAVLERLRHDVPEDRVFLVDAKRGDVPETARAYARALLDGLGADAVTVNPLLGQDSVEPFLERPGRGAFFLTRTSNSGAVDLLERTLADGRPLFLEIAELAQRWDAGRRATGLVVGATAPQAVAAVRRAAPHLPLLVPGVGAQGGDLDAVLAAGLDAEGYGVLVAVSRGIAAAPEGPGIAARRLAERIAELRSALRR